MALCEDGQWRAIANSGQDFHRHAKALDAYFKGRVRALTYERFGVRREIHERTKAWEITGVPENLRDAFSRRAAAVDAKAGADASRQEKQRVSAETRRAKVDADAAGMRTSWRTRAEAVVDDVDAMVAAAAPGPPGPDGGAGIGGPGGGPRIPPPTELAAVVFDPETGLTSSEKTFSRAQLLAAVANALEYGIGNEPGRLDELADQVLAVEGYAVGVPHVGSTVMSSTDRYTTQDILDAENVVTAQALARYNEGAAQLTAEQAAAAVSVFEVANGFELSTEQRAVIHRTLTAGHGIDATVGVAGAGKSTLMEACRIGWDATGATYAGATLAAVAAKQLTDASGIPARTVASWLKQIDDGKGLTGVDVLVVDEATMVDDRAAAKLMTEAARTGTKIVAIGDPKQMQAIGPGGWFREVHRLVNGLTLTDNRRQQNDAERAALEVWRTGDHEQALKLLADGGRVHAAETADEARSQILTTWDELRTRWPDTHDLLDSLVVLAARNSDVDLLNVGAQQIRRAAGELGDEHTYALPGGEQLTLAVGDAVRVRVNDYRSRKGEGPDLLNGYRATVTGLDLEDHRVEITWRIKDAKAQGGYRNESAWMTREAVASGALSLGYAMTVAASQGLTAEVSLLYGHGSNAFATYPGITRGRQENHIWLPLQVVEDEQTQARLGAARSETERLQRAVTAFARFLGQDRGDTMVSDLLREPPAPATAPLPVQREHEEARRASEEAFQRTRSQVSVRAARAVSTTVQRSAYDEAARALEAVRERTQPAPKLPAPADEARTETAEDYTEERRERLAELTRQREMRAVPSWNQRPLGDKTDGNLRFLIGDHLHHAEASEAAALTAEEKARELDARLTRERASGQTNGQAHEAAAGAVVDRAEKAAETAREELLKAAEARQVVQEAERALERLEAFTIRLGGMREKLPEIARWVDGADAKAHTRLLGQAKGYREGAVVHRDYAALARAEQVLRATMAKKFPELHGKETQARNSQIVEQNSKQAAQHQAASAFQQTQQNRGQGRGR